MDDKSISREIYAQDSEEALKICLELSASGQADLFRGQTADWPKLIPSLFRLGDDARKAADAELELFSEWTNGVPQMHPYHGKEDAIIAIAQHYGLSTSFLDLTNDPETALRFAKSEPTASTGNAVIYGFLENDLRKIAGISLLRISVDNLWRLETQNGLFMNYLSEEAVDLVKSKAIKIILPRAELTEADTHRLYPPRKSALETILDQWFYKRQCEAGLVEISRNIKYQIAARRQTYPGLFLWREVPELTPEWLGCDPRWVLPPTESVNVTEKQLCAKFRLEVSDVVQDAKCLGDRLRPIIFEALATRRLLKFDLQLAGVGARHSKSISKIANWAWDGMRILPYDLSEHVNSMSNIMTLLAHTAKRPKHRARLPNILFGETQIIDVAPVGGHIESGHVSKRDLNTARTYASGKGFTNYGLRKKFEEPDTLSDFITDPWLLFDFFKFKKIFIEQFIPTAINGFWESDLGYHSGNLKSMWSVPFNPALLGYVTNFQYRFNSPLALERDIENLIIISHDMDKDDIREVFLSCMPQIAAGGEPFSLVFHGYGADEKELWEINAAIQQSIWIVEIGGISVLKLVSIADAETQIDPISSKSISAFEVWLISKGLLQEVAGKSYQEAKAVFDLFLEDIASSNRKMDQAYKQVTCRLVK